MNNQTKFVLVVKNKLLGDTNVYDPVGFEYKKGNVSDPTALVVGLSFVTIFILTIASIIFYILKMQKKKRKVYENFQWTTCKYLWFFIWFNILKMYLIVSNNYF